MGEPRRGLGPLEGTWWSRTRCRWPSTSSRSWPCWARTRRARPLSAAPAELRFKESDRIAGVSTGCGLGADIEGTRTGSRCGRRHAAARRHHRRERRPPPSDARRSGRAGSRPRELRSWGWTPRRSPIRVRARPPRARVGCSLVSDWLSSSICSPRSCSRDRGQPYGVALGAAAPGRTLFVADRCWDVGGLGTLVLGIWLALNLDQYDFFDGGSSARSRCGSRPPGSARASRGGCRRMPTRHRGDALGADARGLGLLVLMVWKPGA